MQEEVDVDRLSLLTSVAHRCSRKKKCDEMKPKCSDCRRLNLPCTQTVRPSRKQKPLAINNETPKAARSSNSDREAQDSVTSASESTICPTIPPAGTTPDHSLVQQTNPIYQWLAEDTFQMLASSIEDGDIMHECNQENGESSHLGFDGVEVPDFLYDGETQTQLIWDSLDPMIIPYSLAFSPVDHLSNEQDKMLFHHYTHVVSRSLCIASTDDDNPFLKLMIPLASGSSAVMGAILALSAVHLKYNGGYPESVQRGLKRQIKGMSSLKRRVHHSLNTTALTALNDMIASESSTSFFKEQALATILLFCIIDIREGNSSRWRWHIAAAKTVITSDGLPTGTSVSHTSSWPFLLDIFEYVDSLITISQCQPPLIDHEKLRPEEEYGPQSSFSTTLSHQPVQPNNYNAVFGVARPLFRLIGQISALSSRRKDRMKPFFDAKFRRSAAAIKAKLLAWEPPMVSASAATSSKSTDPNSRTVRDRDLEEAGHAAIAIRWASILRLHQIVDGYALPHPVPTECLQHILHHLQHIRVGSAVESLMVFPLVMAGSVALRREERMPIRSRWLIMERTIGFGNIAKGGKLQEQIWEAMDGEINGDQVEPGKVTVNWASIRWHKYGAFVMF